MAWPSRVINSGITNPLLALNICGDGSNTLTATGASIGSAYPLASVFSRFSTVVSGKGAVLPVTETGMFLMVANDGSGLLKIYPRSGSTVDGASSVTIGTGKRRAFFTVDLTTWLSLLGA